MITVRIAICISSERIPSSLWHHANIACKSLRLHTHWFSCEVCVSRYIEEYTRFECPKCKRVIQRSELKEETKEVFETRKIREARSKVTSILNEMFTDYDSEDARKYLEKRNELCIHSNRLLP